jgi:hypothetical protein
MVDRKSAILSDPRLKWCAKPWPARERDLGSPRAQHLPTFHSFVAELPSMLSSVRRGLASFAYWFLQPPRRSSLFLCALVALGHTSHLSRPSSAEQTVPRGNNKPARGVEIANHDGYPELHVDGVPFFVHSAAFFYYRIPRDLWEPMLTRYRSLGINTIDIYIPWNWHEPSEGELDFDGHTNPRRNLRALLTLIAEKRFKLIARPGPEILNEWRHGGYPDWLLKRPEFGMDPLDWLEGRYAPLDRVNVDDAEAAAHGWLANATHMSYTRHWLQAVAKELAPYSSDRLMRLPPDAPEAPPTEASGPLLFVQLGDDFSSGRTNHVGPDFWRYVEALGGMLETGELDVPVFINPMDMRVSAAGSVLQPRIGVMGQWYPERQQTSCASGNLLTARDAGQIEFFTDELKTQPDFPPIMIEYQAGWYAPADDDRPRETPPENTLLSSRLLIGNGIHGLNYFPLQDTITPAGYSVAWANRSYRWDAALSPEGYPRPRLEAVLRNARLLDRWGRELAASHKRADFGLVDPLGAYPEDLLDAVEMRRVSQELWRIERLGTLATLSSELLDPEYQPLEQLLRHPLVLLPVFDPAKPQFQLSEKAQASLVEYVRRGGTLLVFPERPAGTIFDALWRLASPSGGPTSDGAIRTRWKFGSGEVIESSKDFFSWIALDQSLAENRAQEEAPWAVGTIREFMTAAGVRPSVSIAGPSRGVSDLIVSEIVSQEGSDLLGERKGGWGFLSLTNLSPDEQADATLSVLSPASSAKGSLANDITLPVVIPPRESLLLPLEVPVCFSDPSNPPCGDAVAFGGAEFLNARRDGKTLELLFYVPVEALVELHLAHEPSRITLDQTARPDTNWNAANNELQATLPRGAAPNFLRTLEIQLPYEPHVPKKEKPERASQQTPYDLEYRVESAVRLPTSDNEYLPTYPPLVVPDADQNLLLSFTARNSSPTSNRYVNISIEKPLRGSRSFLTPPLGIGGGTIALKLADLRALANPAPGEVIFHSAVELHAEHDRRTLPVAFLLHSPGTTSSYRFDFDRDGRDEWVLENDKLRLIVSPESGGRAMALMDKPFGTNLTTSVGLLRDGFSYTPDPADLEISRARGRYGLFDRPYDAQWQPEKTNPVLELRYDAPDVFPRGASIEKTIQLEDLQTVRVDYYVAPHPAGNAPSLPPGSPPQSFVVVNSFPAAPPRGVPTRFCWAPERAVAKPTDPAPAKRKERASEHCEDFHPDGEIITVPVGTSRVEVRTPDRPTMAIEWECAGLCAQMTIEPKKFSALFRLAFPPFGPGSDRRQYTLRIRSLHVP